MNDTPQNQKITASAIKQVRVMGTNERPNDAIIEVTTNMGTQHFLLPKASLPELAEKLKTFAAQNI